MRTCGNGSASVCKFFDPWFAGLALAALFIAVTSSACMDQPEASEQDRDGEALQEVVARLEQASQRLSSAADRVEEQRNPAAEPSALVQPDALRLLALLSQLQVELDIVHRLIDPDVNGRPRHWPLNPEDELALTYVSLRLTWINVGLSEYLERVLDQGAVFTDESTLSALAELMTELDHIHRSVWGLRHAHAEGTPIAPATRSVRAAQAAIDDVIRSLSSAAPQASTTSQRTPWASLHALERLQWAAETSCSALGCFADHAVTELDPRTLGLLRYSSLEFDAAHQRTLAFPRQDLRGSRCRFRVAQAETAVGWAVSEWRAVFEHVRSRDINESDPISLPGSDATKSLIHLFREVLLDCSGEVAPSA